MIGRRKLGEIMYIIPVMMLLAYAIVILFSKATPKNGFTFILIAFAIITSTVSSFLTEEAGITGIGTVKKSEKLRLYWFQILFQSFLAALFIALAFIYA